LLSNLVSFKAYRLAHPLSMILLDRNRFLDGTWYNGTDVNGTHLDPMKRKPITIQNNWIIGLQKKMERAKMYNHWFWDEKKRMCSNQGTLETIKTSDSLGYHGIKPMDMLNGSVEF